MLRKDRKITDRNAILIRMSRARWSATYSYLRGEGATGMEQRAKAIESGVDSTPSESVTEDAR